MRYHTDKDCHVFYFTAYQCPQFSHYSQCANACSSLCPEISQMVQCPKDCEEGCQCTTGHLYDGHACVPAEQCGCIQDGKRFKVRIKHSSTNYSMSSASIPYWLFSCLFFQASESKLLQNCTVSCTCGPPLVCEQYSCPVLHSCIVSDGIMGCHKDGEHLSGRTVFSEMDLLFTAL